VREAGEAFKSAAKCDLQNGSKHDSASNLVNAANALRKESPAESGTFVYFHFCFKDFYPSSVYVSCLVECFKQAINMYTEDGRFSIAAKTAKDIGEILEQEENYEMAIDAFQKAADFYDGEGSPRYETLKKTIF
jgi:alpha-soluble NSF attachment protein